MKKTLLKRFFLLATLLIILFISGACSSLSKNCRVVKHHYPQTWEAINELAIRQTTAETKNQLKVREEQCQAFRFLSDRWNENMTNHREVITMALYRWGWLPGDVFPDCREVVDYQMVYMEFLQKTESKTP